jgi:gliding motility-associated-like protein
MMLPRRKPFFPLYFGLIFAFCANAQPGHSFLRDTFCANQSILVGNQFFNPATPAGTVVLPSAAFNGGDSTIHVAFEFRQPVKITLEQNLCYGDTLWVNGVPYHAGYYLGEETVQEAAANGCDSIIQVRLTFSKPFDLQATICEGDTLFVNGSAYTAFRNTGEEILPGMGAFGCDSIVRVRLESLTPPFSILRDTLCPDGFLMVNGTRYDRNNRAGLEILPNAASTGCDSLVNIGLSFRDLWVYAGEDSTIVKGDIVCLSPDYGLTPAGNFAWSPDSICADPTCATLCVQPLVPVTFSVAVTDVSGCVLRDTVSIRVTNNSRVYAPTVFSPDAAAPNNRFFLSGDRGVRLIQHLWVTDRWGELLFERKNIPPDSPDDGWDGMFRGKVMHTDTYLFWAEIERIDGTTFQKAGSFSLIR